VKRWIAAVATVVLLGAALMLGRRGPAPQADSNASTPEECIERMFDAAKRGDVAAYLDCFTGPERERLERELAGQPEESFARSLVEAVKSLKGRAIFETDTGESGDPRTLLSVDRVYASRTERQTYHLVPDSDAWRIYSVETATAFQPYKPYGTPVYEPAEPEQETPGRFV
jgi:hypothetical protein